jgi:hypothetical protein
MFPASMIPIRMLFSFAGMPGVPALVSEGGAGERVVGELGLGLEQVG